MPRATIVFSTRLTPALGVCMMRECRSELDGHAERVATTPPPRHHVVIRRDLPVGVAGAMLVHAAGETGPAAPHTIAVVLEVADEPELLELYDLLVAIDAQPHLIREPDAPWNGAAMALALRPGARRRELRHLRLWRPTTT